VRRRAATTAFCYQCFFYQIAGAMSSYSHYYAQLAGRMQRFAGPFGRNFNVIQGVLIGRFALKGDCWLVLLGVYRAIGHWYGPQRRFGQVQPIGRSQIQRNSAEHRRETEDSTVIPEFTGHRMATNSPAASGRCAAATPA
jgi:hypothetical protein